MAKAVIKTVQQEDRLTSNLILIQKGTFNRFGIGGVPKGHEGRKEHGGEMVPGPWHFIYGLASVISAHPGQGTGDEMARARAEDRVIEVADGDKLNIDGLKYTVKKSWNGVLVLEAAKKVARRAK
jgi:hypothetical protein